MIALAVNVRSFGCMTDDVSDVQVLLNSLVKVCLDGEHGYRAAAADVENSELQGIFKQYEDQRTKFAKELRAEIGRLGGESTDTGTVGGAIHRGWLNVKSAVTGSSAEAILAACETGEDSAAVAFERAVDSTIGGETRVIVGRQAKQIREAHRHILRLKREAESGVSFQKNG
jgi:uncharacterized protein (TIGR02284 family)